MKNSAVNLVMTGVIAAGLYAFVAPLIAAPGWFYAYHYVVCFFILLVTFLFDRALEKALQRSNAAFIRTYMGGSGLRLSVFLLVIFFYAFFRRSELGAFTLCFFWYYLVFTSFEVASGYKRFGQKRATSAEQSQ